MIGLLTASALMFAQAAISTPGPDLKIEEHKDVAFEDLSQGRTAQAVAQLEALAAREPNDPALLINLGYGYMQQGRTERAAAAYRAASLSRDRYDMELADGSWVDSRLAAEQALAALSSRTSLASLAR